MKVGNFTINSTGSQSVTGVGFQPKAVLFFTSGQAGAALFQSSVGAADESGNEYVSANRGAEGGDISGGDTNDACIWTAAANAGNDVRADITSMDSDGFTINVSVAGSTAIVGYIAFA